MKSEWSKLFDHSKEPSFDDIEGFVDNDLWLDLNTFLKETYSIQPKLAYSKCAGQPGWNVKYQKSGKSLCTLYPMDGFFIALVVIGKKETPETEFLIPICSEYTQGLYDSVPFSCGGKWLMMNVVDEAIVDDVKKLIKIRVKPKLK